MEEKYKKIIANKVEEYAKNNEKFVLIQNIVGGKERVFLIPAKRYKQLTNKQKKFLMEDK